MPADALSEKINRLFAEEKWADARALIEREMKRPGNDDDHWLLARLATTYYEQRQYDEALRHLESARKLAPRCPLVLWEYAGILDALKRFDEAIDVYVSLIRRGAPTIAKDECGEGLEWAIGLLTDCLFRVGVCLKHKKEWTKAWSFFGGYDEVTRAGGVKSIYKVLDLFKQLSDLPSKELVALQPLPPAKEGSAEKTLAKIRKELLSRLVA